MMKKILYLLLAVSLGVNAGLMVVTLKHRGQPPHPPGQLPPGDHIDGRPGPPPGQRQGPPRDPRRLVDGHMAGMTRHLDLDPDQQREIRAVLERDAMRLMELQEASEDAGRRLSETYAAPDFDPEAFLRLVAETSAHRTSLDSLSAVLLIAEAAVLTPEQRVKYAEVAPTIHANPGPAQKPHDPRHRPPPRR